jgi:hypothetical protein
MGAIDTGQIKGTGDCFPSRLRLEDVVLNPTRNHPFTPHTSAVFLEHISRLQMNAHALYLQDSDGSWTRESPSFDGGQLYIVEFTTLDDGLKFTFSDGSPGVRTEELTSRNGATWNRTGDMLAFSVTKDLYGCGYMIAGPLVLKRLQEKEGNGE